MDRWVSGAGDMTLGGWAYRTVCLNNVKAFSGFFLPPDPGMNDRDRLRSNLSRRKARVTPRRKNLPVFFDKEPALYPPCTWARVGRVGGREV
jgi:hypothetical protein